VYGLLTKILKIAISYGAKSPAAIWLFQITQKFIAIPTATPIQINSDRWSVDLNLSAAKITQGITRKSYKSQAGYQPQ
jgi:hypothetical protein